MAADGKQARFEVNMGQATAEAIDEIMKSESWSGTEYLRQVTSLFYALKKGKLLGRLAVVMGDGEDRVIVELEDIIRDMNNPEA